MGALASANRAPHRWAKFGTMLACAGTNAATDNLAEGLIAEGVRVVRIGQPAKVCAAAGPAYRSRGVLC
jgi:regulator of nonsense transcripts 1